MKNSQNNHFIVLLICSFFGTACEETIEWELQPSRNEYLIVEAILTNEMKHQQILLSLSFNELNGSPAAVSDAQITVTVNNTVYSFTQQPDQPGHYLSEAPFQVFAKLDYHLDIQWQGQSYQATSQLSTVAPLQGISFFQVGTDSLRINPSFAPFINQNQQALHELYIDWTHLSLQAPNQAKLLYFTFSTVDPSQIVRPQTDTVTFPVGSIITVKKYGLNDDYARYLRSLALETQWKGGLLYGPSASLPSNISNGGLGFFSTCAVLTDTIIAQ